MLTGHIDRLLKITVGTSRKEAITDQRRRFYDGRDEPIETNVIPAWTSAFALTQG
jgi:hypothetical protein